MINRDKYWHYMYICLFLLSLVSVYAFSDEYVLLFLLDELSLYEYEIFLFIPENIPYFEI